MTIEDKVERRRRAADLAADAIGLCDSKAARLPSDNERRIFWHHVLDVAKGRCSTLVGAEPPEVKRNMVTPPGMVDNGDDLSDDLRQ